jgi:hypothetical protein
LLIAAGLLLCLLGQLLIVRPSEYAGFHSPDAPELSIGCNDPLHEQAFKLSHRLQFAPQALAELREGICVSCGRRASLERRPCFVEFRRAASFPCAVLGPVLLRAFLLLAWAWSSSRSNLSVFSCQEYRSDCSQGQLGTQSRPFSRHQPGSRKNDRVGLQPKPLWS